MGTLTPTDLRHRVPTAAGLSVLPRRGTQRAMGPVPVFSFMLKVTYVHRKCGSGPVFYHSVRWHSVPDGYVLNDLNRNFGRHLLQVRFPVKCLPL